MGVSENMLQIFIILDDEDLHGMRIILKLPYLHKHFYFSVTRPKAPQ